MHARRVFKIDGITDAVPLAGAHANTKKYFVLTVQVSQVEVFSLTPLPLSHRLLQHV